MRNIPPPGELGAITVPELGILPVTERRYSALSIAGSACMRRYFFDVRDGNNLAPDEEGMILPSIEAVQEEAAMSLADMARDMVRSRAKRHLAIEVRDAGGPVVEARFQWSMQRSQ